MPQYKVELYGDVGFTADGSNILDFLTREARDAYFDNLPHTTHTGTSVNKDFLDTGSIKLEISNTDTIKYANASYMRVTSTRFVQSTAEPLQEVTYLFTASYEVVSSTENTTVIRYTVVNDNWMNYQFNVKLRPCSVERMHVDRWSLESIKPIWSKPSLDGISSSMIAEMWKPFSLKMSAYCAHFSEDTEDLTKATHILKEVDIVWVLVTALHTLSSRDDQLHYHIFPVKISDLEYNCSYDASASYFVQNSLCYGGYDTMVKSGKYVTETAKTELSSTMQGYFPSIDGLDSAELPKMLAQDDDDIATVVNISVIPYLNYTIQPGSYTFTWSTGVQPTMYYNFIPELSGCRYTSGTKGKTRQLSVYVPSLAQLNSIHSGKTFSTERNISPIKPIDGVKCSDIYEPMMFREPVRCTYISNADNTAVSRIPDAMLYDGSIPDIHMQCDMSATQSINYGRVNSREKDGIMGLAFASPHLQWDFMNDAWYTYCITQRDSDRAMMFANIVAGGVADTGSTAVSAGIGYRSNETQAQARLLEMKTQQAYRSRMIPGSNDYLNSQDLSRELWAKSQLASSMGSASIKGAGFAGATAIVANTVGSVVSQYAKESTIKNTPSTLAVAGNVMSKIIQEQIQTGVLSTVCDPDSYQRYLDLYSKFGYAIMCVTQPNLRTRKFYNYLKTNGAIVTGNAPQTVLLNIASMFDAGTTIWHMDKCTKDTLYDYTYENIERTLIS